MMLPRIALALSVTTVGLVVMYLARVAADGRVFLLDLGREATERDRARVRRTSAVALGSTLLGVTAALFSSSAELMVAVATLVPLLPVAWMLGEMALLVRTLPNPPAPARFSVALGEAPSFASYLSLPLEVANAGLLVLGCAAFWVLSSELPQRIPLHFDAAGRPNRWGSPAELWFLPGVMTFMLLLRLGISAAIAGERWALPKQDVERYVAIQHRRRSLIVRMLETLMLGISVSFTLSWFGAALAGLPGKQPLGMGIVFSAIAVSTVTVIGTLAGFIPAMLRAQNEIKRLAGSSALGTRAAGWKWGGMVYYAPDDPAVFVPKQLGVGQTLNFARPAAWLVLIGVLVIPLAGAVVSIALGRR